MPAKDLRAFIRSLSIFRRLEAGVQRRKRSEAAQIAAQNGTQSDLCRMLTILMCSILVTAQLMPSVSYAHLPNDKGKEQNADGMICVDCRHFHHPSDSRLIIARIISNGGTQPSIPTLLGFCIQFQFARCMSNRYRSEQFPRCVSCTRRWAGDTCRFQGIRFFLKDPQQEHRWDQFSWRRRNLMHRV